MRCVDVVCSEPALSPSDALAGIRLARVMAANLREAAAAHSDGLRDPIRGGDLSHDQ